MKELLKFLIRLVGGFILFTIVFPIGVTGFALSFAGLLVAVLCWVPMAFPELLDAEFTMTAIGITPTPEFAMVVMLVVGITLLVVGICLVILSYYIIKGSLAVDKSMSRAVDEAWGESHQPNKLSQLEQLSILRAKGVLTDEEFDREKSILLRQPYVVYE